MSAETPEPDARDGRLAGIEHVRGAAALAVAWFHLAGAFGGVLGATAAFGWLGVDCFFVISGFVIPLSMHRVGYTIGMAPAFLARRLVRLEPPYLISIALVVVLNVASSMAPGFAGRSPEVVPAQLALHLFYLIPLGDHPWLNPVYWSLAYEFAFYMLAAMLFPWLWHRSIVPSVILVCGLSVLLEPTGTLTPRIPLFLMGLAAVRLFLGRDTMIAAFLATGCAVATMTLGGGWMSALAGCATALVLARTRPGPRRRTPWLGRISYALYLTHVPVGGRVVNLGRRFVEGAVGEWLVALVALVVSLAFAALFHRLAERPFLRLSRRIAMRVGVAGAPLPSA